MPLGMQKVKVDKTSDPLNYPMSFQAPDTVYYCLNKYIWDKHIQYIPSSSILCQLAHWFQVEPCTYPRQQVVWWCLLLCIYQPKSNKQQIQLWMFLTKNKEHILMIQNTNCNGKSSEFKIYITVFVVFWSMVTSFKGLVHIQDMTVQIHLECTFGTYLWDKFALHHARDIPTIHP